jgi:hypothetical protein
VRKNITIQEIEQQKSKEPPKRQYEIMKKIQRTSEEYEYTVDNVDIETV